MRSTRRGRPRTTNLELGRYGIWQHAGAFTPELAREIESLGFGAIWLGGSRPAT